VSIVMFGITSLICGLAQSAPVLIVSRFFQGMGGGAMLICQVATATIMPPMIGPNPRPMPKMIPQAPNALLRSRPSWN
ncbi:hypothetical protein AB3X90_40785, partial [Paraburkholderia sp. BR14427]